jgi:hypothetical protein
MKKLTTLTLALLLVGVASAITIQMTPSELSARADVIVTGTVTNLKSEWDASRSLIYTYFTVVPDRFEKGASDGALRVRIPGGEVGDIGLAVEDVPVYTADEKVTLYLVRGSQFGVYEVLGNGQGKVLLGGGTVYYSYSGYHRSPASCNYYINSTLPSDWSAAIQAGDAAWDAAGSAFRLNYLGATTRTGPTADGYNIVWRNDLGAGGTIAANYYWYDRRTKIVSENDIIFNTRLPWSTSGAPGYYDVQNIATHEQGHYLVLNDLYKSYQSEMTMYGYGATGETKKRTLETGDKDGIKYIYGIGFDRIPGETRAVTE